MVYVYIVYFTELSGVFLPKIGSTCDLKSPRPGKKQVRKTINVLFAKYIISYIVFMVFFCWRSLAG